MSSFANIAWKPRHDDVASAKAGGAGPTVGDRKVEGQTSDRIGQRPLLPLLESEYATQDLQLEALLVSEDRED
jgi:hypothetical protein